MGITLATVPFAEAADFFKGKIENIPTEKWADLYGGQHSRAFMVAGAMQDSLLGDIRASIQKAIDAGTTLEDFRKDFDTTVEKHGWSYKGGRNWRTAVIYNTNLRTAYHAGRYKQQMDPEMLKFFPNLRYVHGNSLEPRPEHLAWNGVTLPADDPWWNTHYGQNGWGCKCRVESAPAAAATKQPEDFGSRAWKNPSTGKIQQVPVGIDPGFDYNPGMARGNDDLAALALEKSSKWKELPGLTPEYYGRPAAIPADAPKAAIGERMGHVHQAGTRGKLESLLHSAIGGEEAAFIGPDKKPAIIGNAIVDHMMADPKRIDGREAFFPLIKEVVENPYEIWAGWAVNEATGKYGMRKRYVKMIQLEKNVVVGLVADSVDNVWTGMTFFRGNQKALGNLRNGNLLWGRKGGAE